VGVRQGMLVSWITYFNERIYGRHLAREQRLSRYGSRPPCPRAGPTPADRLLWQKVWEAGAHEP